MGDAAHGRRYRLITFDVYSALFDIAGSLVPVVRDELESIADAAGFVRVWRSKQLEYTLISNSLGGPHVPFRIATERALDYTLKRADCAASAATKTHLTRAWDELRPWPEADEVLGSVKARGYPIAMLSNGDVAMLNALRAQFSTPFDHVFACEQASRYKPHPDVYELPLKALNLNADEILHVAGGATDVIGARHAGLHCGWSNRHQDFLIDPGVRADFEWNDLRGLLTIL
ncbi:MAG TPA: haloacid dehalogenase type II [Burkholderiales bacterium]|nr:haloacid dehalogenase type II [Burkholderiales bacterium]